MANVPFSGGITDVAPLSTPPDDYLHVQASPESFGAGIGRALEKAGPEMSQAGEFFSHVQTDDAINNAMSSVNKIIHGTGETDPLTGEVDRGFLGKQGADALNAQKDVNERIQTAFNEARTGLKLPAQQVAYDQATRSYQERYVTGLIGTHADREAHQFATGVNKGSLDLALEHAARNADNDDLFRAAQEEARSAAVKQAHLEGGAPEQVSMALQRADQAVTKARLEAISVKDPGRALKMADEARDTLGTLYEPLTNQFRSRAEHQDGVSLGESSMAQADAANPLPAGPVGLQSASAPAAAAGVVPVSVPSIVEALHAQESGGRDTAPTSAAGAVGGLQIKPATFQQYTHPGEALDIGNIGHQGIVAGRIVRDALDKSGGNPAAAAVAYFSGIGNVAPPGSATPWVRDLVDPTSGLKTSAYVQQVTDRLGSGANSAATLRADAYARVMSSDASPAVKATAISHINTAYQTSMVAAARDEKARRDANDGAANGYVQNMLQGKTDGLVEAIATDPRLTWETRRVLGDAAEKHAGSDIREATLTYGPGFWDTYKAVTAPPGDPNRISDPNQILRRAGPGGDLTLVGAQHLVATLQTGQRSLNDAAVNTTKAGLLNYAKQNLSFEQDVGSIKIRDPKGEALFSGQFIPKFEAAYDKWVKDGKNPWEFLTKDQVDGMIDGLRPKAEMDRDRIGALGEASGGASGTAAPLPPAPEGVDAKGWAEVIGQPPAAAAGGKVAPQVWGNALQMLLRDPSPQTVKAFNESKFGRAGYDAATLLKKLRPAKPEAATPDTATHD